MQSIERQLRVIAEKANIVAKESFQAATIITGQSVIAGSPVDKGSYKNGWNTSIGAISYYMSKPDKPSGQDSIDELVETITDTKIGAVAYFTNPYPYGKRLEYDGWSDQAPNGFLRINTMKWPQLVAEQIERRRR